MSEYYNCTKFEKNDVLYVIKHQLSADFILGLCVILIPKGYIVTLINSKNIMRLTDIHDVNKIGIHGGYIMYENKTVSEASEGGKNRILTTDEGTTGYWIYISSYNNINLFNMYGVDNSKNFIDGIIYICDFLNINYKDYILGNSVSSEGQLGPLI
jgi:hypothetical protein